MGLYFKNWQAKAQDDPETHQDLRQILQKNRSFSPITQLDYGDHGLQAAKTAILSALSQNQRIALYADYDVDGTMSCVAWIWFFEAIGYDNYTYYIPDRFEEGYGVNLKAIQHLALNEKAQLIITMDTGITANDEARWCRERDITFICTDHHKIQTDLMPDCIILNPKLHPDQNYQELCGCGITFVLLRKLGSHYPIPLEVWNDLLAITGMATICDVVPLNNVNHRLARLGVEALRKTQRKILHQLFATTKKNQKDASELDVGFRIGPRINAVGRLEHAHSVIKAFIHNDPDPFVRLMEDCNVKRRSMQADIYQEALALALQDHSDLLVLAGDWHQGVVGIAASKIAEYFWKPVFLCSIQGSIYKGSARSIPQFDVTQAMLSCKELFIKCGGHEAAGGFSFYSHNFTKIKDALQTFAKTKKQESPHIWQSKISYDCKLKPNLLNLSIPDMLHDMKPFGHRYEEPIFLVEGQVAHLKTLRDKVTGEPRHTKITLKLNSHQMIDIMFFNLASIELAQNKTQSFLVKADKNYWQGRYSLQLIGVDVN